jgi:alpha-D-ribose 1-methylphosphonate 5-triphosphate synthase subunit PhnH
MDREVLDHVVYRAVLEAMSRPGAVRHLPAGPRPPLLMLLEALLDHEVSVHVAGEEDLEREIRWRTGSRPAAAAEADFAIFPAGSSGGGVRALKRGTLEFPDRAATAVYRVRRVSPDGGEAVLRGPGIRDRCAPRLEGLAPSELPLLAEVNREYPLGVDAAFVDEGGGVLCIPRSTRIEVR